MTLAPVDAVAPESTAAPWSRRWSRGLWPLTIVVGLVALAAVLTSTSGRYIGDNRFELYWDPFGLLERHLAIWDSTRGLGRPRWDFWPATAAVLAILRGVGLGPDLAERVWHAALLTTAGVGAAAALRLFRPRLGLEHWLVALLYAFGPFAAVYLLPTNLFVGHAFAPWFLFCFVRGARGDRPWRWAAVFALLVFVPGNMNYPALIFAALTMVPAALYLVLVERSVPWRAALGWGLRAGGLALLVSAAALVTVRASSAINQENLQLTETVREINRTSSWSESWRGLGFWGAYWGDSRGAILPQFARFFWWPVVLLTFAVPVAALATLWRSRWRPRLLYAGILVLGLILMVGAYPLDAPTPYGRALLWAFDHFPGILAVRSGHKAGVLVALGAATLAAVAFAAVVRRARARAGDWRRPRPLIALGAVGVIVLASAFPFWTGRLYSADDGIAALPAYWEQATEYLDARPGDGRVLVVPSTALGAYTWGRSGDDILEGVLDRPSIARGLLTTWSGTEEAADLVAGIDDYVNAGDYEPGTIGPIARRLGIEYVLVRNDLDWPATNRPRPASLDALRADPDLELVRSFGAPGENVARPDALSADEAALAPIELYRVKRYGGVARADDRAPLVVSGDGDAWPGLAADGELTRSGPVRYSGAASAHELERLLGSGSPIVITDTNRRRAHEIPIFDSVARSSYTLAAGQELRREAQDLFETPGSQAVAAFPAADRIEASSYGRPPLPQPYYRPSNAFDRDPRTSWRIAPSFVDEDSQWVRVVFDAPRSLDSVAVVTAQTRRSAASPDPMHVTHVTAVLSDGTEAPIEILDGRGRAELPPAPTTSLELRIDGVGGSDPRPFGLAEVTVDADGEPLDLREAIQLPDDVARAAERSPALRRALEEAPVTYQLSRLDRVDGRPVERSIQRRFRTVGTRDYTLRGTFEGDRTSTGSACADIGLRIDGSPVAVRDGATSGTFEGCAPISLDGGWHVVQTDERSDVRRVWLSTDGANLVERTGERDRAQIAHLGRADFEVDATTHGPAAIISGQSSDDGWSATIDGADAGAQVSLDTQAAWHVEGVGDHHLEATQEPQTSYGIALVVTGLGLLLSLFLVIRGRFR
ncbi:MAG: alpha-(1-_3)-arabinofuranosyltransferase family protein [Acidimicrobiia bacterium]